MVVQEMRAQDAEDLRWLRMGWLRRARHRTSVYSVVTAGLAVLFAALGIIEVVEDDITPFEVGLSAAIALGGLFIAVMVVFVGAEMARWIGFVLVVAHALVSVYYLGFSDEVQNAIAALQELPIMAMYFSWFYGARIARIGELIIILVVGCAAVAGPFTGVGLLGTPNLIGAALFTWLCLEAGLFVRFRLRLEAHTDELTGVLNRRGFLAKSEAELRRARRHKRPLTLVVLDLDKFKEVNDTDGHAAGDDVLKSVTAQWMTLSRATDIVGRLGGDEFAMLLPETSLEQAESVVRRMRSIASHPWSWGAAQAESGETVMEILVRADAAMYDHKRG